MSELLKQILVPVDFSEQSLIALGQSYNLSRLNKAELTLLHVIDDERFAMITSIFKSSLNQENEYEDVMRDKLKTLANDVSSKTGIKVSFRIEYGKVYDKIVDIAKEIDALFIVMGTNGSVGLKKFIGSNALRVIRESICPVITIKGKNHRNGCRNIVLPLDLTKETKEKVNKAIELAKYFGSSIRIVSINDDDDEFIQNKLKRQLSSVTSFIAERGVEHTAEIIEGSDIGEKVVEYANSIDADLIMIMTQEEMYWTSFFIGSAAQEVINSSEIPVLSIRPGPERSKTIFVPY
jgi:nucleotide-binding universal stress UspA family protein